MDSYSLIPKPSVLGVLLSGSGNDNSRLIYRFYAYANSCLTPLYIHVCTVSSYSRKPKEFCDKGTTLHKSFMKVTLMLSIFEALNVMQWITT